MENQVLHGVMGLAVADALGVPVEFMDRSKLAANPVTSMRAYGTFHQPAGTWSDDTSMTLCLVDSLSKGLDYEDMMMRFNQWLVEGMYTPFGQAFDIGNATNQALARFQAGSPTLSCGGTLEGDNGNGSLMRILPILYYLQSTYGHDFLEKEESFDVIHNVSKLTHAHPRSQIACGIYISIASLLLQREPIDTAVKRGVDKAMIFYKNQHEFVEELHHFNRLEKEDFAELPSEKIQSSGYVVTTLEAAIWCLLTKDSYKECVLKAVNLGHDTDTVAAVAGGFAGIYYGYDAIPKQWLFTLVRRTYVENLCQQLDGALATD